MSTSTGYLIPDKSFSIGQFKQAVRAVLEEVQITADLYDREKETLAAGEKAGSIVFGEPGVALPFEYAEVHDTNHLRLVPDSSADGYGAICGKCGTDMDDSLYDELEVWYEDEYDNGKEEDMSMLTVTCLTCGKVNKLPEVKFEKGAALKKQYIQFVDISGKFDAEMVKVIGDKLGCGFEVMYEKM